LPIAQFPKIAPPVVTVSSIYTGASAQAVESSVTTPLEEAINGVQGLRYMSSVSGNDGSSSITCTFELTRDLDQAANDVQNAINSALGRLPSEVKLTGVTVGKNAGSFIMAIGMNSTNPRFDAIYLSNYADRYIVDELKRVTGVSDIRVFGERKYAMRIWIDPKRLADNGLAASDVVKALQDQNVQVAAGAIGQPPALRDQPYQISVHAIGRLTTPAEFGNVVVKATPDGGFVRISDVGHVELGAESYQSTLRFNEREAIGLGVLQLPSANALNVSRDVRATMDRLSRKFPAGVTYKVAFDTTQFVDESIKEVTQTLLMAIVLVILVIFIFLQDWRVTLIPSITIPISLIGTFALMKVLGFSINTLTLFGMTLATGLVVDDAIVVVENISRYIQQKKKAPLEAAELGLREIFGAVMATSLVLLAVFVPVAFFPGTTGLLYNQFALTIACSISISAFNALTLTPALSALLLRSEFNPRGFFLWVNEAVARTRAAYGRVLPMLFRARWVVAFLFALGLAGTYLAFKATPRSFVPLEDQGYFIVVMHAPEGGSLAYTNDVIRKAEKVLRAQPEIVDIFSVGGFTFSASGVLNSPNVGIMFARLKPWGERPGSAHTLDAVVARVFPQLYMIPQAQIFAFNPPPIMGLGFFNGFQYQMLDQADLSLQQFTYLAYGMMGAAAKDPKLQGVYTTFRVDTPQLEVNVDRDKAQSLGVPLANIFQTMQIDLGSLYVNDFDFLNRDYRVYVQAQQDYRSRLADLDRLYVASANGAIMPLTELVKTQMVKTSPEIDHYNLFRSILLSGQPAPGYGSGQALDEMKAIGQKVLPPGISYAWSGISLEEIQSGAQAATIFALGLVFVFLVLAAQYESFTDPLIILISVPLAMLGALLGLKVRGFQSDVFAQVGFVMLIGLASKNAILIVEFANQLQEQGKDPVSAVREAAMTRLRPILMTSIAFILGIVPLVVATGAGSAARNSLGTAVFGGMILSTVLNLFVVPVVYVFVEHGRRKRTPPGNGAASGPGGVPAGVPAADGSATLREFRGS
jgi:HAE1 family hydrophobic/amphiphilic exporter-1